jgi:hypothetical protein
LFFLDFLEHRRLPMEKIAVLLMIASLDQIHLPSLVSPRSEQRGLGATVSEVAIFRPSAPFTENMSMQIRGSESPWHPAAAGCVPLAPA